MAIEGIRQFTEEEKQAIREKRKERNKKWREENPDKVRVIHNKAAAKWERKKRWGTKGEFEAKVDAAVYKIKKQRNRWKHIQSLTYFERVKAVSSILKDYYKSPPLYINRAA